VVVLKKGVTIFFFILVQEENYSDCRIMEGHFLSPFVSILPGIVPVESETAYFQIVLPKKWNSDHYKPICLHLAGTGDHVSLM
jgi:hypothetical protein